MELKFIQGENQLEDRTVLVTGASGFIGSNVSSLLRKKGYNVLTTDIVGNVDLKTDIRNLHTEIPNLSNLHSVVHLAAKISVPESFVKPELYHDVNVVSTRRIFESCVESSVPRIVFASSAAVYGDVEGGLMRIGSENTPASPYAENKKIAEEMAEELSSESTKITCLRFFNVYGPGQLHSSPYASAIPLFIEKLFRKEAITIYGDGEQTRDFIHVNDVSNAIIDSYDFDLPPFSKYNLGNGKPVSVNYLVELLRHIFSDFGYETEEPIYSSPREGDILHSVADMATNAPFYYQTDKTEISMGLRDLIKRTLSEN
tara:strand:+ start:6895 stop:7839 length:945 start_codon:yes stop_codon:yes gene_type:complete